MKKIILQFLLIMMFVPLYVNAETCEPESISIESIKWTNKSDNIEENTTVIGKKININLSMLNVGDNIEYKIAVKNNSKEDYKLNNNDFNINSDYIDYKVSFEDNSNIVKSNSSKIIYLKVEYKNKVSEDNYKSGTKNDNKSIVFNLSNENNNLTYLLKNPNTGNHRMFVLLIIICGISFILLKKTKYIKYMILIIGITIIVPISVFALCKSEIIIESNVVIKQTREVVFYKQWKLYGTEYEYMKVPITDYNQYLDLYMTSDPNYDADHPNQILSESLKKVNISVIPKIINIDNGHDYKPNLNNPWRNYWYKITYNVPKYDENGNELHYILKENHIYGLDVFGGDPEHNLGMMVFDPYNKNYNRIGITDEERELVNRIFNNITKSNDEIPYYEVLPVIITPNDHYLFGVGEENTLFNGIGTFIDTITYIG